MCRWVVIHGMGGFGKTVLAAEAVRDAEILRKVFTGDCLVSILQSLNSLLSTLATG